MTDAPQTKAEVVRADRVEISQGGAGSVEANTVTLEQGGAGRVRAGELSVAHGGVGLARADNLRLGGRSSALAVVANQASVTDGSQVFLLIGRSINGNVRPVLDWRAAAALGVGFGFALRLLRR